MKNFLFLALLFHAGLILRRKRYFFDSYEKSWHHISLRYVHMHIIMYGSILNKVIDWEESRQCGFFFCLAHMKKSNKYISFWRWCVTCVTRRLWFSIRRWKFRHDTCASFFFYQIGINFLLSLQKNIFLASCLNFFSPFLAKDLAFDKQVCPQRPGYSCQQFSFYISHNYSKLNVKFIYILFSLWQLCLMLFSHADIQSSVLLKK